MSGGWHDDSTLEDLPPQGRSTSDHDDLHVVLECDRPAAGSTRHCLDDVDQVLFRRGKERRALREEAAGIQRLVVEVPDSRMSSVHATMRRASDRWLLEDTNSRNGSYLDGRRVQRAHLADGAVFQFGHTYLLLRSRTLPEGRGEGPRDAASASDGSALATLDHQNGALFARMLDASRGRIAVLLVGEAGSGKDSLARAVHAAGRRGAFVVVPCALLGRHESGDGPDAAAGLADAFARAAGGTLYLDEIEGLSAEAQVALLPLLRSRRKARVAGVLSSLRSGEAAPAVPRIAADLFAELAGFTVPLPPLRDRREDLGALLATMLSRAARPRGPAVTLDPSMGQALLQHDWPFNLSELESCVRSAMTLSGEGPLRWSPPARHHGRPAGTRESSPPPREAAAQGESTTVPSEPGAEFAQALRRALRCNLSVSGLQRNELLRSQMVLEATQGSVAETSTVPAFRDIVRGSLDSLESSSPRGRKQAQVLRLTFIEPAGTQQEAADQLAMAFGTYRRYVTSALAELTSILWFRELSARRRRERSDTGSLGETALADSA
ncbi:MAG TPA: sigma 54-interacting transcriptional regulator [Polyangiaceae bacterium]